MLRVDACVVVGLLCFWPCLRKALLTQRPREQLANPQPPHNQRVYVRGGVPGHRGASINPRTAETVSCLQEPWRCFHWVTMTTARHSPLSFIVIGAVNQRDHMTKTK